MKNYILGIIALATFAVSSCRKIETDGQIQIIDRPVTNIYGDTTNRPAPGETITITGKIATNTTFLAKNTYILKGGVYVTNNAKLTVEAGTVIKGAFSGADVAYLVITRGAQIEAKGTPEKPIIFTSSSPTPQSGDWGGIVICGKAKVNKTEGTLTPNQFTVEGLPTGGTDNLAGGDNDADNSGTLQYLRIEYAGYAYQPDKEINSLTLAGVGSGTTIDHIQVSYAKDDAYEFFGGTVNCKYLIAYKTLDDDFDTDNGYTGKIQFGLVIRDSSSADISKSEAFESDNNSSGSDATPQTAPIFSNITAIGPRATTSSVGNALYRAAAHIRRNTSMSLFNSVIMGWPVGLDFDAAHGNVLANIESGKLKVKNTTIAGCATPIKLTAGAVGATIKDQASLNTWFADTATLKVESVVDNAALKFINPFSYTSLDPTPFGGSSGNQTIIKGAAFTDPFLTDAFFTKVEFRGAIAPAGEYQSWWKGWSKFN